MEYKEYLFKERINIHNPEKYLNLAEEIRKYFPDKNLRVEQIIDSVYNKGKKNALVQMTVKIISENGDKSKFKEMKLRLEEILETKLIEKTFE